MKLTVQVRLLPDAAQEAALRATLDLASQAANLISEVAWQRGVFRAYDLHRITYGQVRALGLSAQPAVGSPWKTSRGSAAGSGSARPSGPRCTPGRAFHQLGRFVAYKARRAGVVVVHVDPAYSSQACSACGHVDRDNRVDQATFHCRSCGFAGHADWNAARNIAERGAAGWAAVSQPHAYRREVA